jgi:hypothetical protein
MADGERRDETGEGSADLRAALRRARLSEAERSDVIVELRAAEVARLELLAEALEPVIAELPADTALIDCQIVPGHRPRFWIDMLGYVQMGHDRRGYELVSETRAGSQVLFRSGEVEAMAAKVTDYIAHRLVERDRQAARARTPLLTDDRFSWGEPRLEAPPPPAAAAPGAGAAFWQVAFSFMLGVAAGMVAMLVLGLIVTG